MEPKWSLTALTILSPSLLAAYPDVSPGLLFGLLALGFLIGILGHLAGSRPLIALGVGLVFAATVLLPIVYRI